MLAFVSAFPKSLHCTDEAQQAETVLPAVLSKYIYDKLKKIPEGQEYAPRLEPAAPIRLANRNHAHYPSRHRTVLNKRRLNDGLPARLNQSTRESSEDVFTYTWHTKSMVQI